MSGTERNGLEELRRSKDAILLAALPDIVFDGWSRTALRAGARHAGIPEAEADALFPGGATDLVAWFSHWADREMLARLEASDIGAMKIRERIATAVRARLDVLSPHREAVRRALSLLALPQNGALGLRLLYDTVDAAWRAVGDTSTDYNFYTKRALLGGVVATTTLCWLDDRSEGNADTYAFLDRRIADVMKIPRATARLQRSLDLLPNPLRMMRAAQRR